MQAPGRSAAGGAISVSVVSHGHGAELLRLLNQFRVEACTEVAEVIVTLNTPEPGLADRLLDPAWPFALRLVENPVAQGFGRNHNQAFALATGQCFCVVNPDIRLRGNPFPALLAALRADPRAGCAYPLQYRPDGQLQDHQRDLPSPSALLRRYRLLPGRPGPSDPSGPDWVNAAFLLFARAAYAEAGGFDERYFMYCEDVDLSLRLRLLGRALVAVPDATVEHAAHRASRRDWRHLAWHLQSLLRLWRSPAYRQYRRLRQQR